MCCPRLLSAVLPFVMQYQQAHRRSLLILPDPVSSAMVTGQSFYSDDFSSNKFSLVFELSTACCTILQKYVLLGNLVFDMF